MGKQAAKERKAREVKKRAEKVDLIFFLKASSGRVEGVFIFEFGSGLGRLKRTVISEACSVSKMKTQLF